jgi:hypothetical protein
VLPLGPGQDGKSRVVVEHAGTAGHITVVDADKPERATARVLMGFFYDGLLDREVP